MQTVDRRFLAASGSSLFDAAFLAVAGDAWWVGVVKRAPKGSKLPLDIGFRLGTKRTLTGIWRDPEGGLWVSGLDGIRSNASPWGPDADRWERRELDAPLHGITGVDARCVLAWGIRESDGVHVLRLFNGARWNPVGSPGFALKDAHITAPDRIWVCGGGVARWNGEGWDVLEQDGFVSIHAASDDAVFVVHESGAFGRVTPAGFETFGVVDGARCIAAFQDALWIGAGDEGLWRYAQGELSCVREDRFCVSLEAHEGSLLIGCDDIVASTEDGRRFPGGCRGILEPLRL